MNYSITIYFLAISVLAGCATVPSLEERRLAADVAIASLQVADFEGASAESGRVLETDPNNPYAALVRAITTYKTAMHNLILDIMSAVVSVAFGGGVNDRYLKFALQAADKAFVAIDNDLALAAAEPKVDLELCLACWEYDWNRSGEIDKRDRRFFEVERDANGKKIKRDDPRRRPTFRYDYGDVIWARAYISFHRAVVSLALAFDFSETLRGVRNRLPSVLKIPLIDKAKIGETKQHLLAGLDYSDQCRLAYLAEDDDDREWLPSPRQKNHPLPLEVNDALYATWEGVVSDVRNIINGEEGLSIAELAQLGDHQWDDPPTGYLNVGRMFDNPTSVLVDIALIDDVDDRKDADQALRKILGQYHSDHMKPSGLLRRLTRMKSEVERGQESIERKLQYLLWIN